jgi:hypothetical protein
MSTAPVPLGSALLTLVDPDRGAEVEFNRWYERDHIYGGALLGPGVFAGGRFLARDSEKRLRVTEPGGDPNQATMLNLYWLTDDGEAYWRWSAGNVKALHAAGRMSAPGRPRSVLWLGQPWSAQADPDGVPAELALDHRFPAAALSIVTAEKMDPDELGLHYRESCVDTVLAGGAAALAVGAVPRDIDLLRGKAPEPVAGARVATLWFLRSAEACAAFVEAHEKAVVAVPGARTTWLSPFIATVPGTDIHLDRLWL